MSIAARLLVKLGADTSEAEEKIEQFRTGMVNTGKGLRKTGTALTGAITAPLVGLGVAALTASTDFNAGMANVQTLLTDMVDGGLARTRELGEGVQSMAIDIGKSTDDLSSGLYQVISAFGDSDESLRLLEINARAAAAGLATTEEAVALTSAITKNYGDTSAAAVQNVADLAFQTVKLGQTTFPELAGAMGRVAGMSANLGVSQEELFAVMATSTGVLGSASEVSTAFSGALQGLMAPSADMAALFEKMGVASGAALIEQHGLHGALSLVAQVAEESGTPLQKYFGSIEGLRLVQSLAGESASAYAEKLLAMSSAVGASDDAFAAQTEGFNASGFAMQQMRQELSIAVQDLGTALVPALTEVIKAAKPIVEIIGDLTEKFSNLSPETQKNIAKFFVIAAAIGPVVVALGSVVAAASALAPLFSVLATAVGLLLNPIVLVGIAIGGLLAVLFDWGGANEKLASTLEDWGLEGVADGVRGLHDWVEKVTEAVGALFSGQMSFSEFFDAAIPDWLKDLFDWTWPLLGPVGWVVKLTDWEWPDLNIPDWVNMLLYVWTWPVLEPIRWIVRLMDWAWPSLNAPGWIRDLLDWEWPSFSMPSIPGLGGLFGGDENATGGVFASGLTMVGERGPELVQLPQGSRVYTHEQSMDMVGASAINVTINANVDSAIDIQTIAYRVARELQRRRR